MPYDEEPLPLNDIEQIDNWIEQALRARLPQPESQHDRPDLQLIQELHDYYTEQAQTVNHRLDRVWQRFEQRAELPMQGRRQIPSTAGPLFPQERRHPMREPSPLSDRSPWRWPSRLSALAAAVLLVVVVGGLIAGLVVVRHGIGTGKPSAATPTPITIIQPSPTAIPQSNLLFDDLHMTSATTGWAIAVPPNTTWGDMAAYKVLRTSDGGSHWKDVTPKFTAAQAQISLSPFLPHSSGSLPVLQLFLNDSAAWILDLPDRIFETADSGNTWQVVTTPAEVAQYSFINTNDGWVLGTDSSLYQTTDGGNSWTKLQSMGQGTLPYNNTVTGLVFHNANDGWMTAISSQADTPWMYVTRDGGQTWQLASLSLPPGATIDPPILVTPPTFLNDTDGFVWANLNIRPFLQNVAGVPQSGGGGLELYLTHDGGATWQDMSMLPGGTGALSFSDGNHGWVTAQGTNSPALWITSDGAHHWSQIDTSPNLVSVGQLDFVSATTGWAVSFASDLQSQTLLKTENGGHTWTQITYSISS